MSTKQHNNEEEVDLGSLFKIIGRGFSQLLDFIVSIFKGIFHVLILTLLFARKHFVKIFIAGAILGVVGYIIDFDRAPMYESKMLVKPNFESTKQLYGNVLFYNDLVIQKEYGVLAQTFKINDEDAKALKEFEINPIVNENDIVSAYNKLVLSLDTTAVKSYKMEDFKKAFTTYDYEIHEITVKSEKNDVFTKIDDVILSSVRDNSFFKRLKESENVNLDRSIDLYKQNLKDADSLRKVYMKAILAEAQKSTPGTSIDMGGVNQPKDREIELFQTSRDLNNNLTYINNQKAEKSEIVNVVSSFQEIGNKSGRIRDSKPFLFFVLGAGIMILFLLLKELNVFLNNYKK